MLAHGAACRGLQIDSAMFATYSGKFSGLGWNNELSYNGTTPKITVLSMEASALYRDFRTLLVGFHDANTGQILLQAQMWNASQPVLGSLHPHPQFGHPVVFKTSLLNLQTLSSSSKSPSILMAADTNGTPRLVLQFFTVN
eukprot:SAG31_NODE_9902_length_1214_cov_1.065471_1_plen_141_part_00